MDNLGDRVLVKNLRSKDGQRFSVGRFIKLEFDASPQIMKMVEDKTRLNEEILRNEQYPFPRNLCMRFSFFFGLIFLHCEK